MTRRRTFLLLVALMLSGCATAPPVQEMSDARQAITAAEDANAARLAPVPLSDARRFLAQAETQIRDRSFSLARSNALRAKTRALDALQVSQTAVADQ